MIVRAVSISGEPPTSSIDASGNFDEGIRSLLSSTASVPYAPCVGRDRGCGIRGSGCGIRVRAVVGVASAGSNDALPVVKLPPTVSLLLTRDADDAAPSLLARLPSGLIGFGIKPSPSARSQMDPPCDVIRSAHARQRK